ncbi:MAG: flavin reductase family protein [Bacteroidetes bacterium]|nr:flavin reductase family protein [Bacteroidota bacterium]MBK9414738.1 flavin reductase family protein [Bacteroidota bacterium]MBL0031901.1 flavin reductase family protein [Bacteroidota bacterium]MBP6428489.1 flavin reductase family protein [Bacteroidia bacterium]MBP6658364.1 flavin reductase family protein [Bacteroidia bacterium]
MFKIDPKEIKTGVLHSYMLAAIAPRPIAFASTIDKDGNMNLAPFSFFNAFGSNPPTVVFSPARRVRDNTIKHTLENIYETKEVVINVVNYAMVHQMSLASTEYPKGVSEFIKAGFTPVKSELIRPYRVKESPVQMECKVVEVKEMGDQGGAANLIICEILLMHIDKSVLNEDNKIDAHKIDLVARMGGDLYCRASGNAIFDVAKPNSSLGMGIDQLPESIRNSTILTGNNLGQLGNVIHLPDHTEIEEFRRRDFMKELFTRYGHDESTLQRKLHELAKTLLEQKHVEEAWKVLLCLNK